LLSHTHLLCIFQLHFFSGYLKLALSNAHNEHIFAVLNPFSSVHIPPLLCIFPFCKKNQNLHLI
jgi:hypothetical protein